VPTIVPTDRVSIFTNNGGVFATHLQPMGPVRAPEHRSHMLASDPRTPAEPYQPGGRRLVRCVGLQDTFATDLRIRGRWRTSGSGAQHPDIASWMPRQSPMIPPAHPNLTHRCKWFVTTVSSRTRQKTASSLVSTAAPTRSISSRSQTMSSDDG